MMEKEVFVSRLSVLLEEIKSIKEKVTAPDYDYSAQDLIFLKMKIDQFVDTV
jgi:pantothenate kinase